ncbi:unnamed protein product [Orchesella dallaii]|uniref:Uncharacterized protein n=1 Tax=Orchesella dallaii TaxID=48710 RepID=A0ABP1RSW1_9HEXA
MGTSVFHVPALVAILLSSTTTCAMRLNEEHSLSIPTSSSHSISALCSDTSAAKSPAVAELCSIFLSEVPSAKTSNGLSEDNMTKNCTVLDPPTLVNASVSHSSNPPSKLRQEQKLQEILNKGMDQLQFEKYSKTAIFMLGNTGSGKTTLTQTLNGNLSQLHAVLTHSGRLIIIDDQDRIGLPTTTSKTIVPEYVVNPEHNISFFDCPGFDDNRGAETDIAAMYFLKSITDHVNRAKFLFTVTHSSVTIGNDRLDFDLLASHAAKFMSNISKFSNSIGLIVTKVNSFSAWGSYLSDEMLLNGLIEFLQKFNSTLHRQLQDNEIEKNERSSLRRKVQFVEAILQQDDNGNFSKIWFLRNPPKCGPYSEMPYMSQVRERIADLYINKLSYAHVNTNDFGFTLKDKTLLKIQEVIVPEIVAEVENRTEEIITIMKRDIFEDFEHEFNNSLEMKEALLKFNNMYQNLRRFVSTQTENHSFLENVQRLFDTLHYDLQQSYLNQTSKQQKWLDFFDKVSMTTLLKPSTKWVFSNTLEDFRQIQEHTLKLIRDERVPLLISEIENESDSVIISVMSEYNQQNSHTMVQKHWKTSTLKLMDDYKKMKRFVTDNLKQQDGGHEAEPQYCVSQALTSLSSLICYDWPGSVIDRIVDKEEILMFYINIIGNNSSVPKPSIQNSVLKLYEKMQNIRDRTRKEIYDELLPHTSSEIEKELSTIVESLCIQYSIYFENALKATEVKAVFELNEHFNRVNNLSANSQSKSVPTIVVAVNQMYFALGFTPVAENMTQHLIQLENDLNSYEEILEVTVNKPSIESAYSKIQYYIGGIREKTWQSIKHESVPHTFKQIKEIVTYLLDVVQDVYLNKFYDGLNRNTMSSKLSIVKGHYGILVGLKNKWHNTSVEGNYSVATEIGEIYTILGYSMQSEQMIKLERFEKTLDFYGEVTESPINRPFDEWRTDFNELVNRLGCVCDWYEFLVKINTHLQLYTTQVALNTARESSIIWSAVAGLEILERFKIVHVSTQIKDIAQRKANEMDKLQMTEILKNTFQPTIIQCLSNGRKALITGNYVKFTDFMKTPTTLPCDSYQLQEVEIHASEVVYFDSDILALGRELTIRVLGERWEVIGANRKIALNGLDGSPPYSRARSGQNYGDDGRDGVPGNPGGNGGRFFGIVSSVMNGMKLTLDVSAGNGGNGQDGGHGHYGREGEDMTYAKFPDAASDKTDLEVEDTDDTVIAIVYNQQNVRIAGEPGGSGGNGGDGGIAGEPGYPGLVNIIQVYKTINSSLKASQIKFVRKRGSKGIAGEGGKGAKGGKHGNSYSCLLMTFLVVPWWDSCKSHTKYEWAPNGWNGEAGGNAIGQVRPTPPRNNNLHWETITGFKRFVLESGSINGRKFLDTIDASPTISRLG